MDLYLKNKRVLITASSSGIGSATAEVFLQEGADVVVNGRNSDKLSRFVKEMSEKYGAENINSFEGDITKLENIESLRKFVLDKWGGIDILISNLGSGKPLSENSLSISEWERFLNINLFSAVNLLDNLLPEMKKKKGGSIILISSIAGLERTGAPYGYAAAKSSLLSLVSNLSAELAESGIRINCVVPGNVFFKGGRWEEILENRPEIRKEYIEKEVPLKRFADPFEIAKSIVFLSSECSSFTTGAVLVIDGGQIRRYGL
jgi:3-oxoacyl-[acyl-carrier protein] reductase